MSEFLPVLFVFPVMAAFVLYMPEKYPGIKRLYVLFSEIELRNNCPEEKSSRMQHIIAVSSAHKPLKTLSNPHNKDIRDLVQRGLHYWVLRTG